MTRAWAADAAVHLPSSTGTSPSSAHRFSVELETPAIFPASVREMALLWSWPSPGVTGAPRFPDGTSPNMATGPQDPVARGLWARFVGQRRLHASQSPVADPSRRGTSGSRTRFRPELCRSDRAYAHAGPSQWRWTRALDAADPVPA